MCVLTFTDKGIWDDGLKEHGLVHLIIAYSSLKNLMTPGNERQRPELTASILPVSIAIIITEHGLRNNQTTGDQSIENGQFVLATERYTSLQALPRKIAFGCDIVAALAQVTDEWLS